MHSLNSLFTIYEYITHAHTAHPSHTHTFISRESIWRGESWFLHQPHCKTWGTASKTFSPITHMHSRQNHIKRENKRVLSYQVLGEIHTHTQRTYNFCEPLWCTWSKVLLRVAQADHAEQTLYERFWTHYTSFAVFERSTHAFSWKSKQPCIVAV